MLKNKTILWLIVLAVGVVLLILAFNSDNQPGNPNSTTGSLSITPEPSPTPTSPQTTKTPTPTSGPISGFKKATCQIEGRIVFIEPNLYRTEGAKIKYQNVDDVTRQIVWSTTPGDEVLRVGPNLFEGLKVPTGEREVGVTLYGNPSADIYKLNAKITYGVPQTNGDTKIAEAQCSGTVDVVMP